MQSLTALELTQRLMRFNTINPPGNERESALFIAQILENAGFTITEQEFEPGRSNLIAHLPGSGEEPPLYLAGHLDTVPLGAAKWSCDPFAAEINEGKLYGRGSTDMKSGVAAMIVAGERIAKRCPLKRGLTLIFTGGEETGCFGAKKLQEIKDSFEEGGPLIVAEPTSNYPIIGHKGGLWLNALARGVTAHGSMPEKGINAIYKAARAVSKLEHYQFQYQKHPVLGKPTLNVGTISGGININSVPDEARIGIDIRTIPGQNNEDIFNMLAHHLGEEIELFRIGDAGPVWTDPENLWVRQVFEIMAPILQEQIESRSVTYFTDASVLIPLLGHPPTLILGPGEAAMAHQTDEYCFVDRIDQAVEAYEKIAGEWCEG